MICTQITIYLFSESKTEVEDWKKLPNTSTIEGQKVHKCYPKKSGLWTMDCLCERVLTHYLHEPLFPFLCNMIAWSQLNVKSSTHGQMLDDISSKKPGRVYCSQYDWFLSKCMTEKVCRSAPDWLNQCVLAGWGVPLSEHSRKAGEIAVLILDS